MSITYDANGFPILLSENGNATQSANESETNTETDPDPTEKARRDDAVREVARRYKHGDVESVVKYLEERITRPLSVDELDNFHKDVHGHRVSDLVDIIDHQLRGSGVLTRSYRAVKVSAPNGWVQDMIDNIDDDEVIFIARRLKHRGHDLAEVQKFLGKRIKKERFAKLEDKLDDDGYELNLSASGLVEGTFNGPGIIVMPTDAVEELTIDDLPTGLPMDNLAEAIGKGVAAALKELK